MINYTKGDSRLTLAQDEFATYQGNGSVVLNSQLARPYGLTDVSLRRGPRARTKLFSPATSEPGQSGGLRCGARIVGRSGSSSGRASRKCSAG